MGAACAFLTMSERVPFRNPPEAPTTRWSRNAFSPRPARSARGNALCKPPDAMQNTTTPRSKASFSNAAESREKWLDVRESVYAMLQCWLVESADSTYLSSLSSEPLPLRARPAAR